jgi:hypothetical protein
MEPDTEPSMEINSVTPVGGFEKAVKIESSELPKEIIDELREEAWDEVE